MFQAPARYLIWVVFGFAVLAAMGVEGWQRPTKRGLYWSRLGTMGAFAVTIGAGIGTWLLNQSQLTFGDIKPTFVSALAFAGFWGVGVEVFNLLAPINREDQPQRFWVWGVCLWLALDLLAAGWGLNPGIPIEKYSGNSRSVDSRVYIPDDVLQELMFDRFLSFASFDIPEDVIHMREIGLPNVNLLDGTAMVNNFDPILLGKYSTWMKMLEEVPSEVKERMLDKMGVEEVVELDPSSPLGVEFNERSSLSRFRWAPCDIVVINDVEALDKIITSTSRDHRKVILEIDSGKGNSLCTSTKTAEIRILSETPNKIILEVKTAELGYLVAADAHYPG